jgi:hypothetical protein
VPLAEAGGLLETTGRMNSKKKTPLGAMFLAPSDADLCSDNLVSDRLSYC